MTLKITQAAREAAATCDPEPSDPLYQLWATEVREGLHDNAPIVQAFQRAMNQAADDALEAAAKVADNFPLEFLHFYDRPGGPPGNSIRASTPKDIAAAIRGLKGQQP